MNCVIYEPMSSAQALTLSKNMNRITLNACRSSDFMAGITIAHRQLHQFCLSRKYSKNKLSRERYSVISDEYSEFDSHLLNAHQKPLIMTDRPDRRDWRESVKKIFTETGSNINDMVFTIVTWPGDCLEIMKQILEKVCLLYYFFLFDRRELLVGKFSYQFVFICLFLYIFCYPAKSSFLYIFYIF